MSEGAAPVAIVLAAGRGTRMRSRLPKVLFPLLGRTSVERVVGAAREAGCDEVVVVVGYGADEVRARLSDVLFANQPGVQGTGQAVNAARGTLAFADRQVLILPGDVPLVRPSTLQRLIRAHTQSGAALTVASMRPADPTGYGRVLREDGQVARIVEHRDASEIERAVDEVNSSIYVGDGAFLFGEDEASGALNQLTTNNEQQEYLLTDVVGIARRKGLAVEAHHVPIEEVAGVNDRAQLAELEAGLRDATNTHWMKAGVTMDDPATTRIEEGVELARDVILGGGVELLGSTQVGEGAQIGKGSVLRDTRVGAGAVLCPYVISEGADIEARATIRSFTVLHGIDEKKPQDSTAEDRVRVAEGAQVGPFSHLRQSSEVGDSARVGNFVELKKTRLDTGAKANHLAYLGDATVGARSNIGAGVITCNYDGVQKHRTTIGEDVFVGTDSHLIAPVRLGNGAYVATGTTVNKNVPADALAIGRMRQQNKEGYASRLRANLERAKAKRDAAAADSTEDGATPSNDPEPSGT